MPALCGGPGGPGGPTGTCPAGLAAPAPGAGMEGIIGGPGPANLPIGVGACGACGGGGKNCCVLFAKPVGVTGGAGGPARTEPGMEKTGAPGACGATGGGTTACIGATGGRNAGAATVATGPGAMLRMVVEAAGAPGGGW